MNRYFIGKIRRHEAEKQLMIQSNSSGSFLVRESETRPGELVLSIRDREMVRHYRIRQLENGNFFVNHHVTFMTIMDLVAYYRQQAGGLCSNLVQPCLLSEKPHAVVNEEWETDRKRISLVKRQYVGNFGVVWEGLWDDNTPVAIKMLKPGTMPAAEFLQEANFMKKLCHVKVLQLYAVCTKEEPIYIITEFMKHGSMLKYLRGEGRTLNLPELIDFAAQVAAGMAYLEQQNCIHRSLAAQNIMVGEHKICKVANFRLARVVDENVYKAPTEEELLIKWTAPEATMYNRFTIKSDVWSFGIVMCEVITYGWYFPYPGKTDEEVLEALMEGQLLHPRPMGCPDKLYEIVRECWQDEPFNRPTFEALKWQLEEFFATEKDCHTYV